MTICKYSTELDSVWKYDTHNSAMQKRARAAWQHLVLESVPDCCMQTYGWKVTQFVLANSDISGNAWTILNIYTFWSSSSKD